MPSAIPEYRIALRARHELIKIYEFTEARFGRYQAEAYLAGLERTFGLIADFPGIGVAVDEIAQNHRRFRFQSHFVFYTDIGEVVIRSIQHHARKIRLDLFA